jgi:site-specific DNA-methyltransferase (adenine-specific)
MSKIDLIQGDCLEKMKDIPSGSVDCIITDPPYRITARVKVANPRRKA